MAKKKKRVVDRDKERLLAGWLESKKAEYLLNEGRIPWSIMQRSYKDIDWKVSHQNPGRMDRSGDPTRLQEMTIHRRQGGVFPMPIVIISSSGDIINSGFGRLNVDEATGRKKYYAYCILASEITNEQHSDLALATNVGHGEDVPKTLRISYGVNQVLSGECDIQTAARKVNVSETAIRVRIESEELRRCASEGGSEIAFSDAVTQESLKSFRDFQTNALVFAKAVDLAGTRKLTGDQCLDLAARLRKQVGEEKQLTYLASEDRKILKRMKAGSRTGERGETETSKLHNKLRRFLHFGENLFPTSMIPNQLRCKVGNHEHEEMLREIKKLAGRMQKSCTRATVGSGRKA